MIVDIIKKIKNRTKEISNIKQKEIIIILLLLTIMIIFGMLVGISFSRYESKIVGKGAIEIAKPIIEIERQQSIIAEVTAQNPKATCLFEVHNYNENNLNEVEMEYYIEIISNTESMIEFELYKDEELIQLNNNKTEKMTLVKDEEQSDKFKLNITYDSEKNTSNSDINESIEIKVHSIQKS